MSFSAFLDVLVSHCNVLPDVKEITKLTLNIKGTLIKIRKHNRTRKAMEWRNETLLLKYCSCPLLKAPFL